MTVMGRLYHSTFKFVSLRTADVTHEGFFVNVNDRTGSNIYAT